MPYMHIYQVPGDPTWHIRKTGKECATTECGKEITQEAKELRIGGGRAFGNDPDPPVKDLCRKCWPPGMFG